jgi:hypothetical protein
LIKSGIVVPVAANYNSTYAFDNLANMTELAATADD